MTPAILFLSLLTSTEPTVAIVPPPAPVAGVDPYALAGQAAAAARAVVDGEVALAAPPATGCALECRLQAAAATGAPRALVVHGGAMLDGVQAGAVLFDLQRRRALGQCSERVAASGVVDALGRCARRLLGRPRDDDDAAAQAARKAIEDTGGPVRVIVAPPQVSGRIGDDDATRNALASRATAIVAREPGFVAVASADLAAVIAHEANRQLAGVDPSAVLEEAARALNARLILRIDVGIVGDAVVVGAALVDVELKGGSPQRSDVIVESADDVPEAVDAVVLLLFGHEASLPTPRARRTRLEAGLRALVPGAGQFFNGPEHTWKGLAVSVGTGTGVVAAGTLLGSAAWLQGARERWDVGGAEYIARDCDLSPSTCNEEIERLTSTATTLQIAGFSALAAGALVWGAGIVDAVGSAEEPFAGQAR
jgi:hypothetical protein